MSYRTPSHRAAAVNETRNALLASRCAILTTHLNADGDGAGSQAAIASWLRANGTEAWIINPTAFPDGLRFLVERNEWIVPVGSRRARELCETADLAVVLDTGEVPRIGRVHEMIRDVSTVVIDHHPVGDHAIGGVSLRDTTACATGELVYDVILAANGPWTDQVAQGIYVGILTDTGGFRFENATAGCHRVVAEVIERGVEPEAMHERIYGSSPLRRYQVLRFALESLEHDSDSGVSWMVIPRERYEEFGATAEDLEGIVDIPRSISGTEVGLLFRSTTGGDVKISFRSNGLVDVNALARRFNGGGHVKASGAMVPGPMERAMGEVLEATRAAVAKVRVKGAGR
ncbi:MAG: bifunctional oligoribonuclease/PAP phosphatase NrnA [Gemmatimonadetes bacterium]|nr:bifunctional oligoribonuclease/PAP phosphatase NrnA [Gemmatimonadota bacterium]MDA1103005.1 bifunctional oligoribonuclease/PAP phosphatase NrnA [Gemmatimonadota bacterium]